MKNITEYITESILEPIDIDTIKEYVMKIYHASSWEDCIDKQQFSDCTKICKSVYRKFHKMFNRVYDINIFYSPIAIKKLHELGDNDEMNGNHYVLVRNNTLYDFAKGANTINGIYVLTQKEDMSDKYTVKLSSGEKKYINSKVIRYVNIK